MIFSWVRRGLRTGVLTTRYPAVHEQMPKGFRGRPALDANRCLAEQGCNACVQVCLPGALSLTGIIDGTDGRSEEALQLDYARCTMCGLCVTACPTDALQMTEDYELAARDRNELRVVTVLVPATSGDDTNSKERNHGRFS